MSNHCNELARRTGLPPICAACNMGPCPHYVAPPTAREAELLAEVDELRKVNKVMSDILVAMGLTSIVLSVEPGRPYKEVAVSAPTGSGERLEPPGDVLGGLPVVGSQ